MMIVLNLAGVLAITYFVSRLTLAARLLSSHRMWLVLAHVTAFAIETTALAALRVPLGVFAVSQLTAYFVAHLVWLQVDFAMRNYPRPILRK